MKFKWFSYSDCAGFELHETEEMAKLVAQECLDAYIDDAGNEQYSEEIDSVCWGEVKECATEKPTGEVINDYGDYVADYVLEAIAKAGVE